jgi:hypothetical protein
MCLRDITEREYHRYYLKSSKGFYEEVQEIAGLFAFSKANEPIIKKAIQKKRKEFTPSFLKSKGKH